MMMMMIVVVVVVVTVGGAAGVRERVGGFGRDIEIQS